MEAGYGLTQSAYEPDNGDATLAVKFFKQPVENKERSLAEGRPIFEEVDFIRIEQPGNKDEVRIKKATEQHKQRFPEHWRRYEARVSDEDALIGTPLAEWPQVTRSQVEEFKFYNISTVEQLAGITDANLQNMMGGVALKQKARAFIEHVTSNDELAKQLKEAQGQIAKLIAASEVEEEPKKRKRRSKAEIEADKASVEM